MEKFSMSRIISHPFLCARRKWRKRFTPKVLKIAGWENQTALWLRVPRIDLGTEKQKGHRTGWGDWKLLAFTSFVPILLSEQTPLGLGPGWSGGDRFCKAAWSDACASRCLGRIWLAEQCHTLLTLEGVAAAWHSLLCKPLWRIYGVLGIDLIFTRISWPSTGVSRENEKKNTSLTLTTTIKGQTRNGEG